MNKMTWFYLDVAARAARESSAVRLKVGAVIVKDDNIISFSWNGTPKKWDNNCEDQEFLSDAQSLDPSAIERDWPYKGTYWDSANRKEVTGRYRLVTKPIVSHAEANAISKLAKSTYSGEGSALYCTHSPCLECAKLIYHAGIKEVYYQKDYRAEAGIEFLKKCGIQVIKVVDNSLNPVTINQLTGDQL